MRIAIDRSRWVLLASVLAVAAGCSAPPPPHADQARTVHVRADASVDIPPDMATIHATLREQTPAVPADTQSSTDASVLGQSRGQLEDRVGNLIRSIEKAGIAEKDISAGSLNISPETFTQGGDSDHQGQRMVRTRLQRPVTLTVHDLDKVPQIIDALTQAGVDNLSGVDYSLENPDEASDKALQQALERAKAKAELMVGSLGAKLSKVNKVEEVSNSPVGPRVMMARAASPASSKSAPEYRKGQISRKASVDVTWSVD